MDPATIVMLITAILNICIKVVEALNKEGKLTMADRDALRAELANATRRISAPPRG